VGFLITNNLQYLRKYSAVAMMTGGAGEKYSALIMMTVGADENAVPSL